MSKIDLEVNGLRYSGFTDVNVVNSIENLASQFRFSATVKTSNLGILQNDLKAQDEIKVYIDDTKILTGYIEDLDLGYSASTHTISVAGRSRTGDLIDSSIKQKQYSITNFERLCNVVLKDNGFSAIKVINDVETLSPLKLDGDEVGKTEQGDTVASFLDRYAKKVQVLLTTNEDGDLVITREGSEVAVGSLIHEIKGQNNNILEANINVTTTDRYRFIEVHSQSSNDDFSVNSVNQNAIAIDSDIRSTRRKVVTMSTASKVISLGNLAKWSINVRKAKGSRYTCKVQDFYTSRSKGLLWVPNSLVQLVDERCQAKGLFLIQGVSYTKSKEGTFTELSIVEMGAFSVEGAQIADSSKFADNLINKSK